MVLGIIAALLAALTGLGWKALLQFRKSETYGGTPRRITWLEYGVVMALMSVAVIPLVMMVGNSMSTNAALTDYEFWNTTQRLASYDTTVCEPGSSGDSEQAGQSNCDYEFDTGQSYSWSTQEDCYKDNNNVEHCTTVWHTADIYAPYATKELHYYVTDWLGGRYDYPTSYVGTHPVPYDSGHPIPGWVPHGPPASWISARNHIAAHDPLPTTVRKDYKNPIFASHDQDYLTWSNKIQFYLHKGLLPLHTANLFTHPVSDGPQPSANKVMFVHVSVPNQAAWESDAAWDNAALGMKFQGDLHVVVINSALVTSPVDYTRALVAYWQSQKYFDKDTISKNGVILVIGTADGKTIDWAQARTGMPFGNGPMLNGLSNFLQGQPLNPGVIFGHPATHVSEDKSGDLNTTITMSNPAGILPTVMFQKFPFVRACMYCIDKKTGKSTGIGYAYLVKRIQPPLHDKVYILLVVELVALGLWALVGFTDIQGAVSSARSYRSDPYSRSRQTTLRR